MLDEEVMRESEYLHIDDELDKEANLQTVEELVQMCQSEEDEQESEITNQLDKAKISCSEALESIEVLKEFFANQNESVREDMINIFNLKSKILLVQRNNSKQLSITSFFKINSLIFIFFSSLKNIPKFCIFAVPNWHKTEGRLYIEKISM